MDGLASEKRKTRSSCKERMLPVLMARKFKPLDASPEAHTEGLSQGTGRKFTQRKTKYRTINVKKLDFREGSLILLALTDVDQ